MLSSIFIAGSVPALRNAEALAPRVSDVTDKVVPLLEKAAAKANVPAPKDPVTLVRINAAVQITAALALATGRAPRLASATLAASLVPTTIAGHRFWEESDPQAKQQQQLHFFKNLSLLGGLIIAAGDTDGRPGVAYRTRRVARDARREAGHLATSAKQEARLVAAKVG